jgi:hypothetical protein
MPLFVLSHFLRVFNSLPPFIAGGFLFYSRWLPVFQAFSFISCGTVPSFPVANNVLLFAVFVYNLADSVKAADGRSLPTILSSSAAHNLSLGPAPFSPSLIITLPP